MIHVYINYPNPHITIHNDPQCPRIKQGGKKHQRNLSVGIENFEKLLLRFRNKQYRFSATPEFNDMWLEIGLGSIDDEISLVKDVKAELARHYRPFAQAPINEHC